MLCWLASCSHQKRIPHGIMPPEQMGGILVDMQLASAYNDAYIPDTAQKVRDRELRLKTLYAQVLELHHTDHRAFMDSYRFYEDHPDLMQKIYTIMQRSIDRKSAYQDSLSQVERRLQMAQRRASEPIRLKDYLLLYQTVADSFPPRRLRVFKPRDWQPTIVPKALPDFLWLYKTIADSIHDEPRRIFNPDLFN